jgi:hypothetical protein
VPILLGIEPDFAQLRHLEPNRFKDKIAYEGMRLRELVLRAQEVGDLQPRFRPVHFINWALVQHIEVPKDLIKIAINRGLPVRGTRHSAEEAAIKLACEAQCVLDAAKMEIEAPEAIVAEDIAVIDALSSRVSYLEASSIRELPATQETTAKIGAQTRNYHTVAKALYGLAKRHYHIDLAKPAGGNCAKIVSDLLTVDITIDDETLKKHLRAGAEQAAK